MNVRLNASALFYAVIVALLVGLVLGSMVLLTHFRNVRTERWLGQERAANNARSACYAALHRTATEKGEYALKPFGDHADLALVEVLPWGGLDLVRARTRNGADDIHLTALAGRAFDNAYVVDLARTAGPLHLCGDARIIGSARLPQADLRRGHIEGRPFTGERLIDGAIVRAPSEARRIRNDLGLRLERLCHGGSLCPEREVNWTPHSDAGNDTTTASTIPVLHLTGNTHLKGMRITGPLVIRCSDSLWIAADNRLEMVIIQAPFITIEAHARISVQCCASGGIVVGEDVEMLFPTLLAVWRDTRKSEAASITIGSGSVVQGAVVLIDRSLRGRDHGAIMIGKNALVHGEVYAEGGIQHQGAMVGTMAVDAFILRTTASVYHGHMLDGTVAPYDLERPWGFGCITEREERTILQWGEIRHI